ncbi:F-box/WD repeat-containing protein 4 isoform X8 [Choloepus didactylus]|uniref:F-box/WD repeat-containing protein 4 isoform X8 n=1 Tax=Choloepus didactylus TaxID=27675 RepID=UPI00189D68C1|nr:F-box/WD repeat-containing protein 4 isoform X8 [Choloepus didactylus]
MVSPPPAAEARAPLRVGPAQRPLMGSQGRHGSPRDGGPGEGEGGEARKLQEGRVVRGKRKKGKGKAGARQGGRGSGEEGKSGPAAKEAAGPGVEAGEKAGPGPEGAAGGSVEERARRTVEGDEGSAGAGKEAKGRDDGKEEERRVTAGRQEDARPGRTQGRGGQAWSRNTGAGGAAMAAAAEEEAAAAAREPPSRPASGPALWRLPEELLLLICSYLDMRALGRLAQVCRWLRRFTSCDLLWRRIARASLNSGFTRLGTDLMASVPVKERVKVSQNWRLGRCREGILLKWKCSQMPWMQLEGDSLYVSQANFILAYQFRPDGASLNRRPLGVFAGHDEDVCHFVLANSHIISAGGDGKIGVHKIHSTFTAKYSAHEQEVNCVDCKGGIIVSGSRDRTAKEVHHGVGGTPRQHLVLLADRWEPPAGHRLLLLRCCTAVGPAPKGLPACLPADIGPPQQSCVLPALHHQASLCCAVLQPPCPGLSKPMTVRASPACEPRRPATQEPLLPG